MQLTVIEHAGEPVGTDGRNAVVFHAPGGTIGRDSDNHLVLRDDTRQISRLQALLQVADDACLLKNLSSVSTIEVNRVPIGYAQAQRLNMGDIIRIGPYLLRAEPDDATIERTVEAAATGAAAAAPAASAAQAQAKGAGNKLWGLLHERFGLGKAQGAGEQSGARAAPARHRDSPASAAPRDLNQLSTDPLDLFAQPHGDPDARAGAAREGEDRAPPTVTQPDHAPEWTQHVRVQPAQSAPPAASRPGAPAARSGDIPAADDASDMPSRVRASPAPAPATPETLLQAFFEGAGLDTAAEQHHWSAEQLFVAGQLLALFANGTVELLSSRSILKREVKADMTMLLDRENNPLKLLPDGSAVLRQMFGLPLPGFMTPQSAVSDAFQDLHAHQIGMVAGMRAALMDLLTRFSPQRLRERDAAPQWYEKRVPALYKARLWDRYAATHRDTLFAIEDDFASVFGKAFLSAYDAEVESYRGRCRR
ncbi:type VI secretion system-associated FHA domain protein TagH [Burkholderia pseudomallei]|uniref:type VI secretion system-associated FHA domain protein TagH n=1 Tax=Burkholderia pseudomallei TaxID=28450 RepID=UPI00168A60C1|nr:type VI secretion system-associated FHA domain protein TagH [Burkholderia pseudomallei]MBD2944183.1 type VI secretion system-associated FHA domain protein TagH [Burkholderia pseudomallei]MBD2950562.1 type VI secretion system-associated FHA domain protein TagH [Burkholderia pseudomallei]MBD2987733.1 type VI secretion system-associated FHA domain protein TagH [Burkholderia pseudomallei]MBD2993463.1 type VI secretion system-associated FHA domain protein TagH [Burkholderia pseudomallei]